MRSSLYALLICALLCGCTTSYQHMSDPRIANDGFDLVCGGFEQEKLGLRVNASACKNLAGNDQEFLSISVTKKWGKT